MAQPKPKTPAELQASNDDAINQLDAVINKLRGLFSIQTERRKHDAQRLDQTQPATDILDSRQ